MPEAAPLVLLGQPGASLGWGLDWVKSLWSKAALIPKEETHFLLLQFTRGKETEKPRDRGRRRRKS